MGFMTLQVGLLVSASVVGWQQTLLIVIAAAIGFTWAKVQPRLFEEIRRRLVIRRRVSSLADREVSVTTRSDPGVDGREKLDEALGNIARDPIRGPRIYVSAIDVKDFRCFEDMTVTLHHPGDASQLTHPNVNLIIGDNGAGKSTLLKAIAIAALGPILDSSGFVPYHLIRSNHQGSSIRGSFLIDSPMTGPRELAGSVDIVRAGDYEKLSAMHDPAAWSDLFEESDPAFLVVGYGVNRRIADDESEHALLERSRRRRRYQRIASLFDESAVLTPLSSWLPTLKHGRRAEVEELLAELMPAETRLTDSTATDAVFQCRGQEVPYRALSDGYRSFIGWLGDLLFQIDAAANGDLPFDEVGGIVLVDEVDLLLHPSWQREVVPNIARILPKLQFVFTTHSPIVAGTLEPGNILIARDTERGSSSLSRVDASIHGLNAEQILLSSYFEMDSTRAPGAQSHLGKLAERAMNGDDAAAMSYLQALAGEGAHTDEPE